MKKRLGLLLVACVVVGVASSQVPPTTGAPPVVQGATVPAEATHFNVDAATNAYMAELSPAQRANSDAYSKVVTG